MIERRVLSKEEQQIRDRLLQLSEAVQTSIDSVCTALASLDTNACEIIITNDNNINAQQNIIENEVLAAIATQQPVATDLRILVAALHISVELERIADHVSGIAKTIIKIKNHEPVNCIDDVLNMAKACQDMLNQAIQAYMTYDAESAIAIAAKDQQIDTTQTQISNSIIQQMCENVALVPFGSCMLWIVHAIERIGDRTTNICEQTAYIKQGEILDLNR
ncbi:MAG: phosphate signaling complex protein PhoU [Gammaproteobacteria bacterium]|jgi:phosphate transport system protein|nr:phosphate signaling complex protein PhoU [Gammaproteobacteria bacterium]